MTDINKQKFINELSRLLTFMYEEDRQLALEMYSYAFDTAEDEQSVISRLVSPTRQAVIIARAYDAKERKLQIHSQSRAEDGQEQSDEIPDFIKAIQAVLPEPVKEAEAYCDDNQISLFSQDEEAEEEAEPAPVSQDSEDKPEEIPAPAPAQEISHAADDIQPETVDEAPEELPQEDSDFSEKPSAIDREAEIRAELDELDGGEYSDSETEDEAEAEDEPEAEDRDDEPEDGESEDGEDDDEDGYGDDDEDEPEDEEEYDDEDEDEDDGEEEIRTRIKANIPLLILYIIFAVPLTLAGIILLIIPTAVFLVLACAAIYAGCAVLAATFSGFAVFADILVMLGIALIALSLGLLFLWTFIWFIGGAMAGLVRSVISLAHKCCYKEVPVK